MYNYSRVCQIRMSHFLHLQSERSSSTKEVKKNTKIFGQALLTKINSPKQHLKIIPLYRIFSNSKYYY